MGGTLYVSLFEAAQAATEARQNQMAATAVMGEGQTNVLNEVTNSWTQKLTPSQAFSITASRYKSCFKSWLTSSKLKQMVTAEINEYETGRYYSSDCQNTGGSSYVHSGWRGAQMTSSNRGKIAGFINTMEGDGLTISDTWNGGSRQATTLSNYHVGSITTACAKTLFTDFLAAGVRTHIPQASITHRVSNATLSELAAHVAYEAGLHLSSKNPANTVAQTLLNQAQRSYQAAQANANAGVTAVQNQSGQDSYMMQQDGMLATTINTALQQAAGLSISA